MVDKLFDRMLVFILFAAILCFVSVPFGLYFEGKAKSNWLKQTKNLDIPWHEAVFLKDVTRNQDINLNVKQ